MHISEGILTLPVVAATTVVAVPFFAKGITEIKKKADEDPAVKPMIGLVSAAVFVISALPIPSPVSGSSAHPTAIAIAAILLGPWAAVTVTGIVLMLQALFMAHGGISSWGANTMNMGIFGGFVAYGIYLAFKRTNLPLWIGLALAGSVADLVVYFGTSATMAVALHGDRSVIDMTMATFVLFLPSLALLIVLDGLFTVGLFNFIRERRPDLATRLGIPVRVES
jgi:cobalt/nickel transport system permease protein